MRRWRIPGAVALLIALIAANAGVLAMSAVQPAEQLHTALSGGPPATVPQPRRVLALYWYAPDHPVTLTFDRQLQAVLKEQGGDVVRYAEYLEPGHPHDEAQARAVEDYLRQKYGDRKIDAIFCWGAGPLQFLLERRKTFFPDVPIVYYVSALTAVEHLPAAPMTGVLNPDAYARTLDLALGLHPDTTHAYVVSGTAHKDKSIEHEISAQLAPFRNRVTVTYLTDLPLDELIATVRGLPKQSVILYSRQSHEDPDRVLQAFDFLDPISRAASVPIYAPWRSHIGDGSVGGVVDDPVAGASKAANIVVRVARGARPEDIPPDRVPTSPVFDARQLARFALSQEALPAGSVVLFQEPTAWTRFRPYFIGTGLVVALQTLLIGALLVQRVQRRRVEAALRESEERFRVMADTAPVMIWRSNASRDGDFFNLPWLRFRGRSLQEESGSGWMQGIHPDDLERCLAAYTSAFDERRGFSEELRLQRSDGEYRWVITTGVPRFAPGGTFTGYVGSCLDITERKQAEEALRESEARYALATASGAVGVWDWNLETGDVYFDPAMRQALGLSSRAVGTEFHSWASILDPDDADRLRAGARACVDDTTPFFENEYRVARGDGSIRWFLIRGSVARHEHGAAPTRVMGTMVDITDRKRAEADVEATRQELARMARVTSLAQSAASIAHELSQPLASIQMNIGACLRWLSGPGVPTDELHGALLDIAEATTLANGVITRDRDQFRRRSVDKQVLDMNGVVIELSSLIRTRLQQSDVALDMKLGEGLPPIRGDRVELQQVLLNLLLNGIEAIETIDSGIRRLTVETRLAGDAVQTTVRDTGPGIRAADADRIFAPFYTTKTRGTGIGLSISRFIIEHHGGRLWADANHGPGAALSFTVPVATVEAPALATGVASGGSRLRHA